MSLYDELKDKGVSLSNYGEIVNEKATNARFLLSTVIELTPVCNFRCPFCYARMTPEELNAKGESILRFDYFKRIIDELAQMNVMSLTFTGGECTIHPDFCEIYRYAYNKNFEISLLTNGSQISNEILALFKSMPPYRIFITMYGASENTYATVCGNGADYLRVRENMIALNKINMPLYIQFTAGESNYLDLEDVYKFSRELMVPFRYGGTFTAFGRCTTETVEENTPDIDKIKETTKRIFFEQHNTTEQLVNDKPKFNVTPVKNPIVEKGIPCNAGRSSCYINYKGEMTPCVIFDAVCIPTKDKKIADCWKELVKQCDEVPRLVECTNCIHRPKCKTCVAMHYNDTHEFGKPSPRICYKITHPQEAQQAQERFDRLGYLENGKDIFVV